MIHTKFVFNRNILNDLTVYKKRKEINMKELLSLNTIRRIHLTVCKKICTKIDS